MGDRSSNEASGPDEAPASRILVIDDEDVVHVSLDRILGRRGHQVEAVLTAAEGLERLSEGTWDLVITDLMMPEMNGLELLEAMKARGFQVPTMMVTGYPTIKTALQALRLGAVDYIAKPFTRKELLGPVNRALRRGSPAAAGGIRDTMPPVPSETADGIDPPAATLAPGDRVHLRRHSWAVYNQDGTVDVGIGASFLSGVGTIASVDLPSEADLVEQGYVGLRVTSAESEEHGVFVPLSGRVVAINAAAVATPGSIDAETWLIRIVPDRLEAELSHLVRG